MRKNERDEVMSAHHGSREEAPAVQDSNFDQGPRVAAPVGETGSTLAPTMAEAVGFNDRRVMSPQLSTAPNTGMPVEKGHAKHAMADPSMGTANARAATMEGGGARYRVNPPHFMPNVPQAAATQANGRIVAPTAAVHYEKDYDAGVEAGFDDAPTIADYPPGRHRQEGFTRSARATRGG